MHILIPVVFFLTTSAWASSSSYSTEQILSLDNVTLLLGSRFEGTCNCTSENQIPECDVCCTPGRPGLPNYCYPFCGRVGDRCNHDYGRLCCNLLPCINNRCGELESGIDFVVVAKVALAAALIITMVAVVSICYKGFIRPRCSICCGSPPEGDNESMSSVRRYVRQLMDNRPPRYEFQPEKPPSYEECVGGSASGASSLSDPPPYSVAVSISEDHPIEQDSACALPPLYVVGEEASTQQSDLLLSTPLNVRCFQIQDSASVSSTGDTFVMSPINDMDDFVVFSESDSADSISYRQLHSDTPTRMETPSLEQITEGIDNASFVPDEVNQQKEVTTEPLER